MAAKRDQKRYVVQYPSGAMDYPGLMHPGESDDLEEAGRIYLSVAGASDVYDRQERRFVNPEQEIDCVAEAYAAWHREQRKGEDGRDWVLGFHERKADGLNHISRSLDGSDPERLVALCGVLFEPSDLLHIGFEDELTEEQMCGTCRTQGLARGESELREGYPAEIDRLLTAAKTRDSIVAEVRAGEGDAFALAERLSDAERELAVATKAYEDLLPRLPEASL